MPHRHILKIAFLLCAFSLNAQTNSAGYELKVSTDHPDAIYQANETVTFKIALIRNGAPVTKGKIDWLLTNDDGPEVNKGEVVFSDKPAVVTGSLTSPGFLRCKATFKNDEAKIDLTAQAGAGIEPLRIKASMPA